MKNFLFRSIAFITATVIGAIAVVGNFLNSWISFVLNGLIFAIKSLSERALCFIDKDRYVHASLAVKQLPQLNELNLLIAANKVKENAISIKTWTVGHTIAINRIGNALYTQCNWEPARIHKYLKSIVESIPGMVYMAGDDFDDKTAV